MKKIIPSVILLIFIFLSHACQRQNPDSFVGTWEGFLHAHNDKIRLVYRIDQMADSSFTVIHDSPDYGIKDIPVGKVHINKKSLHMEIELYTALFKGELTGTKIDGKYNGMPLMLHKISEDPAQNLDYNLPRIDEKGYQALDGAYEKPDELNDGWSNESAEKAGLDTAILNRMVKDILQEKIKNLHSVVAIKNNKLIIDEYFYGFKPDKYHPIHSVSKGIVANIMGIALEQGLIDNLNTPLIEFFPEYSQLLSTNGKDQITLFHTLSMTAGLEWDEQSFSYYDPRNSLVAMKKNYNPLEYLFSKPLVHKPGEYFAYNSGLVIAMEEIIRRITNEPSFIFAKETLLDPMEIKNFKYEDGYHLCPRDMAKLGQLFLDNGWYKGNQILSMDWIARSMKRFDNPYPKYWNHWYPKVFWYEDYPVKAFQAGGFGGQTITIFPSLDMVLAMTGGSFLEYTNFDRIINDYIIPSALSIESFDKKPELAIQNIRSMGKLNWENRWDTEMACLKSSLDVLNIEVSDAELYGLTGMAFLINVDDKVYPKSPFDLNRKPIYGLCQNLGISVETIWSHRSNNNFAKVQTRVWDRTRKAIDSGLPCYAFNMENPLRYMVTGYDDFGYYYLGWDNKRGNERVFWNELGKTDIGLLGMHFVKPVDKTIPEKEKIRQALSFAIDFWENPEKWSNAHCAAGKQAYDRWINLLQGKNADPEGTGYVSATLAESRFYAVQFLKQLKSKTFSELHPELDKAIENYQLSYENLKTVAELFPAGSGYDRSAQYMNDDSRRLKAIRGLENSRMAETKGMAYLKRILDSL